MTVCFVKPQILALVVPHPSVFYQVEHVYPAMLIIVSFVRQLLTIAPLVNNPTVFNLMVAACPVILHFVSFAKF